MEILGFVYIIAWIVIAPLMLIGWILKSAWNAIPDIAAKRLVIRICKQCIDAFVWLDTKLKM